MSELQREEALPGQGPQQSKGGEETSGVRCCVSWDEPQAVSDTELILLGVSVDVCGQMVVS